MTNAEEIDRLISLLNEKEVQLKDRELALDDKEEEFLSQKEELNAAIEELMAKNKYLASTLAELKQRNEELDQILYRASHDLKTPVSSIMGLVSIMQLSGITVEQQKILGHLSQKTHQMQSLLAALSDLSIAFFHQPRLELCQIQPVLHLAVQRIKTDQRILFDFDDVQPFKTDITLLTIVLTCLIQNAVDYSLPQSESSIQISARSSPSSTMIEVLDFGEQIPSEISGRIFEMFFRGSIRSMGPGLGLYIAQRATEKLQGKIEFSTGKGGGKKFVVTLPAILM